MPGFINTDQTKRPDAAQAIVPDIDNGRTSESCEELMPLVYESGRQDECDRPEFGLAQIDLLDLETPVGEDGQKSVFTNMAQLPNHRMPEVNLWKRKGWNQIHQDRDDDPRSLVFGECISREDEHRTQPQHDRQLVLEKSNSHVSWGPQLLGAAPLVFRNPYNNIILESH